MTKTRSTKRALIMSVFSLFMCLAMLIGTTYAWFTDSVTSANNIIKSGNLDVELYYQVEGQTNWTKVTNTTNVFKEDALWEPGHTEVVKLKVANEGSLALQYNLGVNIASEIGSVNVYGDDFLLSEFIRFAVIDGANSYTREEAVAAAEAAGSTPLKTAYNSGATSLLATEENVVTMVVYMPTSVGNEANHADDAVVPTINLGINLFATQYTYEEDSFDEMYDEAAFTFVETAEEAQAAIDAATTGSTIKLAAGVDYGTLIFRKTASSTVVDITDAGGDAAGNEKYRRIEDLTIIGADGATVDGFDFQAGWISGSGASYIDIENLTVEGVTFSGKVNPFYFEGSIGSGLGIDGLTIVDCKMTDDNGNNRFVFQQLTGYKDLIDKTTNEYVMTAGIKNLTITDCEVIGAYQVIESRAMENLTITNNTFKNIKARDMLITSDTTYYPNVTYTGAITITGNTSIGGEERFVRGSLNNSDAVVVIKDNTIIDYLGADDDYIKVTGGNNVTIENNTMTRAYKVSSADELKDILATDTNGATIYLAADITATDVVTLAEISGVEATLDLNGHNITATLNGAAGWSQIFRVSNGAKFTVKGEGKVHATAYASLNYGSVIFNNVGGDLIINGGTYTMTYGTYGEGYLLPAIVDTNSNTMKATTTINGGEFYHNRNMFRNFAQPQRGANNASLIINGGTFVGEADDFATIWNQKTNASGVDGDGIVTITGGNFQYMDICNDFTSGVTIADGLNIAVQP